MHRESDYSVSPRRDLRRQVDLIVIHCSATPNGMTLFEGRLGEPGFRTPVEVIDRWHAEGNPKTGKKPFRREPQWRHRMNEPLVAIGYHFVVYTSGVVASGRHLDEPGAHVAGNNRKSIGMCMLGTDAYALAQWSALSKSVTGLKEIYPHARVCGHRDLSPDQDNDGLVEPWEWLKTCPGFDVATWLSRGMEPEPQHVLRELAKEARL